MVFEKLICTDEKLNPLFYFLKKYTQSPYHPCKINFQTFISLILRIYNKTNQKNVQQIIKSSSLKRPNARKCDKFFILSLMNPSRVRDENKGLNYNNNFSPPSIREEYPFYIPFSILFL